MDNVLSLEVYISSDGFCRELAVSREEGDKRIGEKSKGKRSGYVFIVYCQ